MKQRLLAKFNRDFHNHEKFSNGFYQAVETFLEDVMLWQAQTGVQFEVKIISQNDMQLMCDVTAVVAEFHSEADYAMYKLYIPEHKIATQLTKTGLDWYFSGWRTPSKEVCYE